ncbi:hypothetical protein C8N43_3086 [Litoreibacter ponti]|uniref:Antifreeze glycopeptide polyprotein n=1 Tax=Litoreibacter ponti TaxID=1510457 RepID=A0A2T6BDX6_9RHOB|nr:hypothetical protein [Litoreibacter ponti]PTX54273.1 hypothetical protein C8N43_3086 [Litoreibacter ponti]
MSTRRVALSSFLALSLAGPALSEEPLSAIDWLSDVVATPVVVAPPVIDGVKPADDVATSAVPEPVIQTTLGAPSRDAVGLRPVGVTGLPARFWGTTRSADLAAALMDLRPDLPPPLSDLVRMILLAELDPPLDTSAEAVLFQARVDMLLSLGALEQARALLERAGPTSPALFRRWFDVSLLVGETDDACRDMLAKPNLSPTYPARIFCMARAGAWERAALTLNTAKTLGVISEREDALIARFLDPELFEGEPPLPLPARITPLNFRMHEAIGEPLNPASLPNAFSFTQLSDTVGWKARISAAERLARSGAISPARLLAIYSERKPAASGGVWDRAAAVQGLEAALAGADTAAIAARLRDAVRAMRRAGLEPALASLFGEALIGLQLPGAAGQDATRLMLLSPVYEQAAQSGLPEEFDLHGAVATGDAQALGAALRDDQGATRAAIAAAFTTPGPADEDRALIEAGNLGLASLHAIKRLEDGADADPKALSDGLRTLLHLGFNDAARRLALFVLITGTRA